MPLKKAERKEQYLEIINLMIQNKNEEAFNKVRCLCGKDTGCFILANYKKAQDKYRAEVDKVSQ